MSRVGKKPINIPTSVKASIQDCIIKIEGPKGKLDITVEKRFKVSLKDKVLIIERPSEEKDVISRHGLFRSLIQNMIKGVSEGYSKQLEIRGVGFKAQVQGKNLTMQLGYSHPINYEIPEGIEIKVTKQTQLEVSGRDKAKVGEVTAEIRDFYIPEPYKGKGIRYVGEYVRHKAGKTVA
ncbi:MAG: 50S ribosomal protein L6 [Candidatus Omnitrophica bacterium]|nr:50S ribosomal protein L6 [Candidatus Omnitrophota bacterium]